MKLDELRKLADFSGRSTPPSQEEIARFLAEHHIDPENLYQEIEMTGRYVDTHRDTTYTSGNVDLHSHSFYEVLYCRTTCGAEYLVGTERYRLQKGDIIMISPGVSHRPILPEQMPVPYRRDVIWMSQEFVQNLLNAFPGYRDKFAASATLLRTAGTGWEYLGELFQNGVNEAERRENFWEAAVVGNTTLLMSQLFRAIYSGEMSALKAEKPELLDQVMGFIEVHLAEHITLAETARHFYVSESTVSQLFRKRMGVSFYRFVTQRRLIAAKTLILDGLPLEEVNERVGYVDYSTFYRAFRQEFGISPRQFRSSTKKN